MTLIRKVAGVLRGVLAEPTTAGLDVDDVETTSRRRLLIQSKPFLGQVYNEWYRLIAASDASIAAPLLEIGSGGGFLARSVPRVITSDVLAVPGVHVALDATALPFRDGSLRGVAMTNVLHHLPDVRQFLSEAVRCTRPGGMLLMIEPWVTPWSRFVYGSLHHEPFDPESNSLGVAPGKPLSQANGALPWIVFERDRSRLAAEFPSLEIVSIRPIMSIVYLLSGGVSMRPLMPAGTFRFWKWLDYRLTRLFPGSAMFAVITVRRNGAV